MRNKDRTWIFFKVTLLILMTAAAINTTILWSKVPATEEASRYFFEPDDSRLTFTSEGNWTLGASELSATQTSLYVTTGGELSADNDIILDLKGEKISVKELAGDLKRISSLMKFCRGKKINEGRLRETLIWILDEKQESN